MSNVVDATELELRDMDVPWLKSEEELLAYVNALLDRQHDYGTCVYAMSMATVAMYYYASHKLGVTGAQAQLADLEFIRRVRGFQSAFSLTNYSDMRYPQYEERFTNKTISQCQWKWLQDEARRLLVESPNAADKVRMHWVAILQGKVPFGFSVETEEALR